MKEMILNALLSSAVYPLVLGSVLALILARLNKGKDVQPSWVSALAILAGFTVCFFTTVSFNMPPHSVFEWMPYIGLIALIAALRSEQPNTWARILAVLVPAGVAVWIFLKPVARDWSGLRFALVSTGLVVIWIMMFLAHRDHGRRQDTPARILLLVVFATTASIVSVLSESAKLAQVSGGLAAATGSLFLVWLAVRSLQLGPMAVSVFLAVIGCVLLNGFFYVEVPLYAIGLVLLSGLAHLLLRLPLIAGVSPVKRTTLVVTLSLLPLVAAVLCIQAFKPEDPYGYEYQ